MMIADAIEHALNVVRERKESWASEHYERDTDLPTCMWCFRGDDMIALIFMHSIDRDRMLHVGRIAANGFDADLIVFAMETFHSEIENNPITGERWGPREMQLVAEKHRGRERGWIVDSLLVTVANRAGDLELAELVYRIGHRGKVVWDKRRTTIEDACEVGGMVPEVIRAMMLEPGMGVLMERHGRSTGVMDGMSAEEIRARIDIVTAELIHDRDATVALNIGEPGSERFKLFEEFREQGRTSGWMEA